MLNNNYRDDTKTRLEAEDSKDGVELEADEDVDAASDVEEDSKTGNNGCTETSADLDDHLEEGSNNDTGGY